MAEQQRDYTKADVQVVFKRGDWQNWDEAIDWLETEGERDNELQGKKVNAMIKDFRRMQEQGAKMPPDPDKVFTVAHASHAH